MALILGPLLRMGTLPLASAQPGEAEEEAEVSAGWGVDTDRHFESYRVSLQCPSHKVPQGDTHMPVITISREYGSRGAAIGARVAEHLGWRYVDDDLIFLVAHRAGIGDQDVRPYDQEGFSRLRVLAHDCAAMLESLSPPLVGQTAGLSDGMQMPVELRRFYSGRYLHVVQQMIRALAARGRVVIMGRGAQVVLRHISRTLHVRTVASLPVRIERVARDEGVDEREAARRIRRRDRAAARYLRHYYRVDWADPLLYHLTLNTASLAEKAAVRLILQAAPADDGLLTTPRPGSAEEPPEP
jgi:cytidylate kinase